MNQDQAFPLLRGAISGTERFWNPRGGGGEPQEPLQRDLVEHRNFLLAQLNNIQSEIDTRDAALRVPGADREIIAVVKDPESEIAIDGLGDKRTDVRVVSFDDETGTVLLDTPATSAGLPHLRKKAEQFAEAKTPKGRPRNEPVIAPIASVALAAIDDLAGPTFRTNPVDDDQRHWFELICRGGSIGPESDNDSTTKQIAAVVELFRIPVPQNFRAPERLHFYIRLTLDQLRDLLERTDCVYEFDLLSKDVRTWVLLREPPANLDIGIHVRAPEMDAPSVVLLDSGIVANHPLLQPGVLTATSSVPGDDSPGDTLGHGTAMAGIALYEDLGAALEAGEAQLLNWVQSSRVIVSPGIGASSEDNRPFWPSTTLEGVEAAEAADPYPNRRRAFAMAITAESNEGRATTWSAALDQIAFNEGDGRLIAVSIGNAVVDNALIGAYPHGNALLVIRDPAQAANALTIGGLTFKCEVPPDLPSHSPIAPFGGISPHTVAGTAGSAIKPDIVLEAGNQAFDGILPELADTMVELSTSSDLATPLTAMYGTSLATAIAGRLGATLLRSDPGLRPATIRGLLVNSARWTQAMIEQLPGMGARLALCGYGQPDIPSCMRCTSERTTIVVEDSMPNAIFDADGKQNRLVKYFRLPAPELLQELDDETVELAVTLSYFAEPSYIRGRVRRGLDLQWDMQGPTETADEFGARVNRLQREGINVADLGGSFGWQVGKQRRSRGTVQSDRWTGPASLIAGAKFIAVYPVLGWWDRRDGLKQKELDFSLIVTLKAPEGVDIYTPISNELAIPIMV